MRNTTDVSSAVIDLDNYEFEEWLAADVHPDVIEPCGRCERGLTCAVCEALDDADEVLAAWETGAVEYYGLQCPDWLDRADPGADPQAVLEKEIERDQQRQDVGERLGVLDSRESWVIRQLFGLGCEARTEAEVAAGLGCDLADVARVRENALAKLRVLYGCEDPERDWPVAA